MRPGKIRQILDYVSTHPLPLYEFECIIIKDGGTKRLRCQTNHLETAWKLALGAGPDGELWGEL